MKQVSSCREICAAVGAAVSRGWLLQQGGKHRKLRSPGGVMLTIPTTPSDHRASRNFAAQMRRIERTEEVESAASH